MSEQVSKENKMAVMPVNKLLISMALPMIISMIVQAMYNIVDSVFVSKLSENALTAVSLAFPMQSFMLSMGIGIGVGMNAMLSRCLGAKDKEGVKSAALNGLFLIAIVYILFIFIGLFLTRPFMESQTNDVEILGYGCDYLRIVCLCSFGFFIQMSFERLLQSTGKTTYTMITQSIGAVVNIILDPVFIFGVPALGIPKMATAGAAIATVIGQCIAGVLAIFFNLTQNHEIHFDFKGFKPNPKTIGTILSVGVPSIIMSSVGSVMVYGINKILMGFTSTATAVFGVYFKLQSFVFMPVFGLNNGMVPIIAFSYGAHLKDRLKQTIKLSTIYAVLIMLIGLAVMQLFPDKMLAIFNASEEMLKIGVPALRIISLHFIFAGASIVALSTLQALGHGIKSMIVSLTRQIAFLLPSAYLLSLTGVLDNVWYCFIIAEIASLFLSQFFLRSIFKNVVDKL